VTPASLNLSKARSHIWNLVTEKERSQFQVRIEAYRYDVQDFYSTHNRIEKSFEGSRLKRLSDEEYTQGRIWVDVMDKRLIPAKLAGDDKTANAIFNQAEQIFEAHRKAFIEFADTADAEKSER
jgi:hypothetical protein